MEFWLVFAAAGALLVRVGLALYTCGLVRAKNAGGSLLRHVADLSLAVLAFWAVGLALFNPEHLARVVDVNQLFGVHRTTASAPGEMGLFHLYPAAAGALRAALVSLLAAGIVVGALSERSKFWPSLVPSMLLGAVVVPLLARWAGLNGGLRSEWFHDYAGASFIHLAGAACAGACALIVGSRTGKYNRDGSSNMIPGHNLPLAGVGALLIVAGWLPYLALFGDRAAAPVGMVCLNALLAAAAGGAASLAVGYVRYYKPDISLTVAGILGALVAISGGADVMGNFFAVVTGAVAGAIVPILLIQIDLVWKLDDPTGALAIHGVGGAWGLLATGVFASDLSAIGHFKLLAGQAIAVAITLAFSGGLSALVFLLLKRTPGVRAREADEFDGLDLAEHDIGSYPDFQQTMIKSYHLREA